MTATTKTLSVLHRCSVAPASDAGELRLPLTYFDMLWIYFHPIERLFFYKHPCSAADFTEKIAPHLKNSLSQTLSHYLPLAGNLFLPVDSSMPELRYIAGDSVAVTLAGSSETARFDHLTGNHPREADEFHLFVPKLPKSTTDSSGDEKFPLLAIQVTHFPDTGIVIGVTNHHAAGDASSIVGFLKAWSSTAKLGGEGESIEKPFYDRSALRDPTRRAEIYWNVMKSHKLGESEPGSIIPTNKVRATFVLQKTDIERLKKLVLDKEPDPIHLSSFTVTIAYFWSCVERSAAEAGEEIGDDEVEYFGFAVDARGRTDPPLPAAYFGNCVGFVICEATHGVIRGEEGFLAAAKAVGELIRDKVNKKGELLSDADEWLVKYAPLIGKRCFGVAGSPKFDVYGVDFGWGKAVKCEAVSIDSDANPSISLCKSREFEGGLELGVSMTKRALDAFAAAFNNGLKV